MSYQAKVPDKVRKDLKKLSKDIRPAKDIELLGRMYTFSNPIEVKKFILTHDYLINPLFEVHKHIREIFGESVETCLEIHRDPEEDFEGLFIVVKTNLSLSQSLELLDKFDEEWWLDVDYEIRKTLEVDIENML